ncbi:MAG: DNA methyltransferase [Candidatus Delongbacteria bacterium]
MKKHSSFNIPGIGPKKESILIQAGYTNIDELMSADFYDILGLPGFGCNITCKLFNTLGKKLEYLPMKEVFETREEDVLIENKVIKPWKVYKKSNEYPTQPDDFKTERTTVWSFPQRGDWASHTPQYRGNWSPSVVRNIIELYSKEGDLVLDPMVGGGTTPVECYLTGRNSISSDINPGAISITRDRLNLPEEMIRDLSKTKHRTFIGDVRNLNLISDDSIDLIATHPPYANIIHYAPTADGDLSQFNDYSLFFSEFSKAIKEMYRVLKPNGYCAILIGDTHKRSHYVPISTHMMLDFLKEGFILKEDIIKKEWNCESSRSLAKYSGANFLLTMHEHLFVFKKPTREDLKQYVSSSFNFFD